MEPAAHWQPQRHLAALMGLFAGLCVVFVDIGADVRFSSTIERAVGAGLIAALIGYSIGWALRWLIRDAPEPEEKEYLSVPGELTLPREDDGESRSSDRETPVPEEESGPAVANARKEREEIMSTEST